jgi:hypothetical protein
MPLTILGLAIAGAIAAAIALGSPAPATAAACGSKVVADWLDDGRIAAAYAPRCYREALEALPEDVRTYSTAQEDIERALLGRLRNLAAEKSVREATAPAESPAAEPERTLAGAGRAASSGETPSGPVEAAASLPAAPPPDRPVLLVLGAVAAVGAALVTLLGLRLYAARRSSAGKRERIQAASSGDRR